jgi:universal stress protein E
MKTIRHILFAVRNPDAVRQPGIIKAIAVAKSLGASLEVFHALTSPVFVGLEPMTGATVEMLRCEFRQRAHARLEKFAALAKRSGVALTSAVEWDYPPHEAIVRRAARMGADLIIAECHKGTRTRPWLIHLTDWELLRTSSLPVLLFKNPRRYRRPVVLAAVDPSHAHAKPARLDADILAAGAQFSVALHGRLHAMHANNPPFGALALGDPGVNASTISATIAALEQKRREDFQKFMDAMDIEPARRHLVDGAPAAAIPGVARKTNAALVVMGAVSRSGLGRMFIGNTAERVLGALPCDVLVLKPRGAKTSVAETPRGMQIVSAPAIPLVA